MRRTTIRIPEELHDRASRYAGELGVSLGELVRRALDAHLMNGRRSAFFEDEELFSGMAPVDSSAHHDRYLYGEEA